jgi:hypothetical protein
MIYPTRHESQADWTVTKVHTYLAEYNAISARISQQKRKGAMLGATDLLVWLLLSMAPLTE